MNDELATAFDYYGDPIRKGDRVRVLGQDRRSARGKVESIAGAEVNITTDNGDAIKATDAHCMILRLESEAP